ncbi:MAG: CHRD domain-containing protein [Chitinophagaceae bacterium]|nr:CHRD domain-containing protein [Chitinophagaceae bacterium]
MQFFKLTVLSSAVLALTLGLTSCEKDAERKKVTEYAKSGILMSGAQETPATPSAAQGNLDVFYSKATRVLNYKFSWAGLADTIVGIHIHGLAPSGFAAAIVQNILTTRNEAVFPFRGGSYSGTMQVDGVKIKEEDLLNALFYVNIHTKPYPAGEIRGQVRFQ